MTEPGEREKIPDEFSDAETNFRNSILVIRTMDEIQWWENMKVLMPMVAKELVKAGVIFPKAKKK